MNQEPSNPEREDSADGAPEDTASSEQVDLHQVVSAVSAALVSETGIESALQQAEAAYPQLGNELVEAVATACAENPSVFDTLAFWKSFGEKPQSPFFLAVLRHIEALPPKQHGGVVVRALMTKASYLGKHDLDEGGEMQRAIDTANELIPTIDDPDAERLQSRLRYEEHRAPYARSAPYREAVADLSLESDAPRIAELQAEMPAEFAALQEAIALLEQGVAADEQHRHQLFVNQTRNRMTVLQMEGRLISTDAAISTFEEIDRSYGQIDAAQLRAGNEQGLKKAHSNTVNRLAQGYDQVGRADDAAQARDRYAALRPEQS